MRISKIILDDYRGVAHSEVELGDGVTVVSGPNEVGKSSIAEALRLLRRYPASSAAQPVKAVQPVGRDVGPQVTIELQSGGYDLQFRKRWLVRPLTELRVSGASHEQLSGREADERFHSILTETLDTALLDALDVDQGESLDQPQLATLSSLQAALSADSDIDATDISGDHDELISRIEAEYERYFTPKGRYKKTVNDVDHEVEQLEQTVADLRERSQRMDALVDQHASQRSLLGQIVAQEHEAKADVERLSEAAEGLRELRQAAETTEREWAQADEVLTAARERFSDREAAAKEVDKASDAAKYAEDQIVEQQQKAADAEQELAEAQHNLSEAEQALEAARAQAQSTAALAQHARSARDLRDAEDRLERAEHAEAQRTAANGVLSANTVTEKRVRRLRELHTEVRVAERARDAAAAQLQVRQLGDVAVTINDETITPESEASQALAVREPMHVVVEGIVSVEVRPAATSSELDTAVQQAQQAFRKALDKDGVTSIEQAQQIADLRATAEQDLRAAESELKAALGPADDDDDAQAGLDAQLERLRLRAAQLRTQLEAQQSVAESASGASSTASIDELERAAAEAAERVLSAEQAEKKARGHHDRLRDTRDEHRTALVRAEEVARAAISDRDRLRERLEQARGEVTDEALGSAVTSAEARLKEADQSRAQAARALEDAHAERIELELDNARQIVEDRARDLAQARDRLGTLQGEINAYADEGIYDRLEQAEAELDSSREHLDRLHRAAAAAKLLHDTFTRYRDDAQARYAAPFRERIERLAELVFGSEVQVEVSADLQIVSRTLHGATVPFESLSGGAREQLALLGRLACAQLVSADGGAPLILDDALGFADPERLRALNLVLSRVGRDAQVVVLTCQPERFSHIGGAAMQPLLSR